LTELYLGDSARSEVSNVSGVASVVFADVGVINRRADNTSTISAKRGGIGLRSTHDGGLLSRVEEQVGVVGRVLSLNETVELTVLSSLLTEDGIPESRRVRCEVWRGVLLSLTVLYSRSDHLGLSVGVELTRSVCGVV